MSYEFPPDQYQPQQPAFALEAVRIFAGDFDAAIAGFDGVIQETTVAFSQARWPKVALEPWIFNADGNAKAGVLVLVQPLPLKLGHIAVVKWGPVIADETACDKKQIEWEVLKFLKAHYAVGRGMLLTVMPRAEAAVQPQTLDWLLQQGFDSANELPFPARYHINVRLSDADQRKSFAQKWRYHLNKAEKANLEFEVADADQLLRFQKLYDAMSDRKNFPDYSAYNTLPHLFAALPETLKPKLFFVTHKGKDVAGAVIFAAGRAAAYLYGATNDQALPLRAGYLMHARIISWLRDNTRADWYDLGGTDGFQGLHQFKKGMVGAAGHIVQVPAHANYAATTMASFTGHGAYLLRDGLQLVRGLFNMARGRYAKPDQVRETDDN